MNKLNLGCGQIRPKNWINTDSSLNTLMQKTFIGAKISKILGGKQFDSHNVVYMNLNKKWTNISDDSIDVVYASHLFEHLELDGTKVFLSEAYRVLRKGGCIRLVMPDLYLHAKEYIKKVEENNIQASHDFLWALNMYDNTPGNKTSFLHKMIDIIQGYPHKHKYMYDKLSLSKLLNDNRFRMIVFKSYGESEYVKDINDVEGPHLYGGYLNSVYIEAIK